MLTYVDERLGPSVFVTPDDVNRYYRAVLIPEMQKRGQPAPPLDQVREDIASTEAAEDDGADGELDQGAAEKADVLLYSADAPGGQPLPPVVKTLRTPAKKDAPKKDAARKPPV